MTIHIISAVLAVFAVVACCFAGIKRHPAATETAQSASVLACGTSLSPWPQRADFAQTQPFELNPVPAADTTPETRPLRHIRTAAAKSGGQKRSICRMVGLLTLLALLSALRQGILPLSAQSWVMPPGEHREIKKLGIL